MTQPLTSNSDRIVEIKDMVKTYLMGLTHVQALNGVSFTIMKGELVAITGSSGSGKSTLLQLLGCLDTPTSGHYLLAGADVAQMDDNALSEIRRDRIGFIFQSFYLIPRLSVLDNIELPLFYAGIAAGKRRAKALAMAKRVGLGHRISHRPLELSGGERQRVAIARALVNDPVVILADEPTGNLDSRTGAEILRLLTDVWQDGGTVVMVTHDEEIAANAQREIHLGDGEILHDSGLRITSPGAKGGRA